MAKPEGSRQMIISVIGGSEPPPGAEEVAERLGGELAKRGAIVACGGLWGVMAAVCRGAKEAGGTTIGILPGVDPTVANPWVDIPICTGVSYARNLAVVLTGRAVVAVDGAYGTLSEIGHALANDIPVIGLDTWTLSRKGIEEQKIIVARDPEDAADKAIQASKQREPA